MHTPVLLKEVIDIFDPKPGQIYIDATLGEGGHAKEILRRISPGGILLGIDWDQKALLTARKNLEEYSGQSKLILVKGNYADSESIAKENGVGRADGILLDLGFGSHTLEFSGRGFSFQRNELLDMRYDPEATDLTAAKIINRYSQPELVDIFKKYGEEKWSRRIADEIVAERKHKAIDTTGRLVEIILQAVPKRGLQKIHPATRVFQALRLAVNGELENLARVLLQTENLLAVRGKIIIISFHSLEDRIVKQFFKKEDKEGRLEILTLKPLTASLSEIKINPRARSAMLRAAAKK